MNSPVNINTEYLKENVEKTEKINRPIKNMSHTLKCYISLQCGFWYMKCGPFVNIQAEPAHVTPLERSMG